MGLRFNRVLSSPVHHIQDAIQWKIVPAKITRSDGSVVFDFGDVEVPASWSDTAINVFAQKYLRKREVAQYQDLRYVPEEGVPDWLLRSQPIPNANLEGGETSAHQVFHRLAGCWTYWGWKNFYFATEEDARIFYDETYLCLARQIAAPNSPQWFNTGLYWAYGIKGPDTGQWVVDSEAPFNVRRIDNSYERPQPHACFIQPVSDDLVNEGGIMDLWAKEVRLFKHGSGTGTNFSSIRGLGERLSSGGLSSGLMSFLKIGDVAAGAIKSGGTTRRAAKMVILDDDHPEIEEFIDWKVKEENKVAAMYVGANVIRNEIDNARNSNQTDYSQDIPSAISERAAQDMLPEQYDLAMEGDAYGTVSGQNSNNTVRVSGAFMRAVEQDEKWHLKARTTGETIKTVRARDLWDRICRAAWACADPGLQFADTINEWHTCAADGEIRASNPCAEYQFLDNTACNLASLNLVKFLNDDGSFNIELYEHVTRLWMIILDISITMASFPSREIAVNTYLYRTLGLGYANLGGLLMRSGIPYDSDAGRAYAALLTALLTGVAYQTSSEMARALGSFPKWEDNAEGMRRVLMNHSRAALVENTAFKDLTIKPYLGWWNILNDTDQILSFRSLSVAVNDAWKYVNNESVSFRNAQVTLLAPTGTIALVMDCDTTGVEPDFSLVKHKSLAGGGDMVIVNQGVRSALEHLKYNEGTITAILYDLERNGGNIYDCPYLHDKHKSIFDCASPPPGSDRCLSPASHVMMVASVQPFLSGAVSKTINMPNSTTIEQVSDIYALARKLGLKAVAIYREGSKMSQPLRASKTAASKGVIGASSVAPSALPVETTTPIAVASPTAPSAALNVLSRGERERPPARRSGGITQEVSIGGHQIYLTMNPYPDGRPCEIFLELSKEGTTLRAFGNLVAMMISMGLQHGVPVERYVRLMRHLRFEPAGIVEGHDRIKMVSSIADFLARELAISFLNEDDAGQVVPVRNIGGDKIVALDRRAVGVVTSGYTGDACPECGNTTLKPAGSCLTCDTCGTTTGCG